MDTVETKSIRVKFTHGYKSCVVTGDGRCRNCDGEVIWVTTPAGKHVPADPTETGSTTCHFDTCARRPPQGQIQSRPAPRAQPQPRKMTEKQIEWTKKMLILADPSLHPDINRTLAVEVTTYLKDKLDEASGPNW